MGRDRDRVKGKVVRIIERKKTEFVGTLKKRGKKPVFLPDNFRFYPKMELINVPKKTKAGLKVLVKMQNWNNPHISPVGEIVKVIGEKGKHETSKISCFLVGAIKSSIF